MFVNVTLRNCSSNFVSQHVSQREYRGGTMGSIHADDTSGRDPRPRLCVTHPVYMWQSFTHHTHCSTGGSHTIAWGSQLYGFTYILKVWIQEHIFSSHNPLSEHCLGIALWQGSLPERSNLKKKLPLFLIETGTKPGQPL